MNTEAFKKAYDCLNAAQKRAVDAIEGAVMVVAGPGTGKTQTLTIRIANILLKTQVNPENVLALTFTESAVSEMRKRLVSLIGVAGYRVGIFTFHGFCNTLIRAYPEDFERLISSESITDLEQIQIMEDIITEGQFSHIKPMGDVFHYVKPALTAINELKKERIPVADFLGALDRQEHDVRHKADLYNLKGPYKGQMKGKYVTELTRIVKNRELAVLYTAYEEQLRTRKQYDYNDMILEVLGVFRQKPHILMRLQEQYQYFLVDEHQDTNAAQNSLVENLCSYFPNPNLFVVGDEKQAIFRFQGASLENFLYFNKLYPEAQLISLTDNYRSTQTILDAAGSLMSAAGKTPRAARLQARAGHPERHIAVASLPDYFAEYAYVAHAVRERIASGTKPREIAILARNNKDLVMASAALDPEGVPYVIESDADIFQDRTVDKLITLFRAIADSGNDTLVASALHINTLGIRPLDVYRLIRHCGKSKSTLVDALADGSCQDLKLESASAMGAFSRFLNTWITIGANEGLDALFIRVLNDSGLMKEMISSPTGVDTVEKLTVLYEDIKLHVSRNHRISLSEYLKLLDLMHDHRIALKKDTRGGRKNAVRLMTVHKSKGLEFDAVHIINAFDGHWGNKRARGDGFRIPWEYLSETTQTEGRDQDNDDERRLFYVAVTRARKDVIVSYSEVGEDGKEQIPSSFIAEIDGAYRRELDTSSFVAKQADDPFRRFAIRTNPVLDKKKSYAESIPYFVTLLEEQGLSATAVNNFIECPWKYFFRNLLHLPDIKNTSALFGSAIHEGLNWYVRRRHMPDAAAEAVERFRTVLSKQPLSHNELSALEAKGVPLLESYIRQRASQWPGEVEGEKEIRGARFNESVFLTGKIDMILRLDKQGGVAVYDFKTGLPRTRGEIEGKTKNSDGNYKRQLVFYHLLLSLYKDKRYQMKKGVIEFVQADEKGRYHAEEFDITDEDTTSLKETISNIETAVKTLSFWDSRCKNDECQYCRMRDYIESAPVSS